MVLTYKKNEQGFTLIELIIVIAVMGILMAVLVPSIQQMTLKAKVITDIRSIQIVQRQLELYRSEHRNLYPTSTGEQEDKPEHTNEVIEGLINNHYITTKDDVAAVLSQRIGLQLGTYIVWDDDNPDNFALGRVENTESTTTNKVNTMLEGLADGTHKEWININHP